MNLGERLKKERERLRMSQPAFAEVVGAKKHAQINWEKGVATPNGAAFQAWADIGVDVLYVLTGVHNEAHKLLSLLKLATDVATKVGGTQEEMANMQETLFNQLKALQLKDDEHELLANYRQCSDEGKATVLATSAAFAQSAVKKSAG